MFLLRSWIPRSQTRAVAREGFDGEALEACRETSKELPARLGKVRCETRK
jgi:hypothetical protein